ncbi:MAG: TetR/AcrR family transcriptional regulator [bacterium]
MKKAEPQMKSGEANGNATDTREQILKAAEALFIERGFDGVSVNDVAVNAGFAKGLVFYYFGNKKELFDSVLDIYYTAQAGALLGAFETGGTVRDRLHSGIDAYIDFIEKNPGYPRLIQREICSGARNTDKIVQYMEPLHSWGTSLLGGMVAETGPMSARHFFVSFFGMVINYYTYSHVLGRLWGGNPLEESALRERREHIHSLLDASLDKYVTED